MDKWSGDRLAAITLHVNGHAYRRAIEPRLLLSDFLRDEIGLTGTHVGCEHGVCGACTVLLEGQAVRSCLQFAIAVQGHEITTIEGMQTDPQFTAVASALSASHAVQCGFCTPGIIASVMSEIVHPPTTSPRSPDAVLSGHLCRCTGYVGLQTALASLTPPAQEGGDPES